MKVLRRYWVLSVLVVVLAKPYVSLAQTIHTHVLSGDAVPGSTGELFVREIGFAPVINASGQVTYVAGFEDGGGAVSAGVIVSDLAGAGRIVAKTGERPPGTEPESEFNLFLQPLLNDLGQTSFIAAHGVPLNLINFSPFSEAAGVLEPVAFRLEPTAVDGLTAPVRFDSFDPRLRFGNSGDTLFHATVRRDGIGNFRDGLFKGVPRDIELVEYEDESGTTNPNAYEYANSYFGHAMNDHGHAVFQALLFDQPQGADIPFRIGRVLHTNSGITNIAFAGDPVPAVQPGAFFAGVGAPGINNAGQLTFVAVLEGNGITAVDDSGIFARDNGETRLVARAGDVAAGAAPGEVFTAFSRPVINGGGDIAFYGELSVSEVGLDQDSGLFLERGGVLSLVARDGDMAIGLPEGLSVDVLGTIFGGNKPFQLNASGQVAFPGAVHGEGVNFTNDEAIFAKSPGGPIVMLAREGSLFDVDDDPLSEDWRTVRDIGFDFESSSGGEDGTPSSINDLGQVTFRLEFTDGTYGVFIASLDIAAIPGDTDGDGDIDDIDLGTAISTYTGPSGTGRTATDGDTDDDGDVDDIDLGTLFAGYTGPLGPTTVPEPASVFVLLTASALTGLRRRAC